MQLTEAVELEPFFDPFLVKQAEEALKLLPLPDDGARAYLEKHRARLARTLALVPQAQPGAQALELGCYMQITPFLQRLRGYQVRGAYFGKLGRIDHMRLMLPNGEFRCDVDHFNAELDPFPYPDGQFDVVIAAEIIEHMLHDPMHLLIESRRVLKEFGTLIVTTPNVASITSVAKTLDGRDNPQIYSRYPSPRGGDPGETGHMREYTILELGEIVKAAGFQVEKLFTTFIPEFESHKPLLELLEVLGCSTENRGEQTYCVAIKRGGLEVDRYPAFLYEG